MNSLGIGSKQARVRRTLRHCFIASGFLTLLFASSVIFAQVPDPPDGFGVGVPNAPIGIGVGTPSTAPTEPETLIVFRNPGTAPQCVFEFPETGAPLYVTTVSGLTTSNAIKSAPGTVYIFRSIYESEFNGKYTVANPGEQGVELGALAPRNSTPRPCFNTEVTLSFENPGSIPQDMFVVLDNGREQPIGKLPPRSTTDPFTVARGTRFAFRTETGVLGTTYTAMRAQARPVPIETFLISVPDESSEFWRTMLRNLNESLGGLPQQLGEAAAFAVSDPVAVAEIAEGGLLDAWDSVADELDQIRCEQFVELARRGESLIDSGLLPLEEVLNAASSTMAFRMPSLDSFFEQYGDDINREFERLASSPEEFDRILNGVERLLTALPSSGLMTASSLLNAACDPAALEAIRAEFAAAGLLPRRATVSVPSHPSGGTRAGFMGLDAPGEASGADRNRLRPARRIELAQSTDASHWHGLACSLYDVGVEFAKGVGGNAQFGLIALFSPDDSVIAYYGANGVMSGSGAARNCRLVIGVGRIPRPDLFGIGWSVSGSLSPGRGANLRLREITPARLANLLDGVGYAVTLELFGVFKSPGFVGISFGPQQGFGTRGDVTVSFPMTCSFRNSNFEDGCQGD